MQVRRYARQSMLGFTVSTLMLPGALAVGTVLLFVTSPAADGNGPVWHSALNRTLPRVCLYAAVLALVFCAVLAVVVCRRFARANSACPGPFNQLWQGYDQATKRLAAVEAHAGTGQADVEGDPDASLVRSILGQANSDCGYLQTIFAEPSQEGLPWLLGTGYIDAWRRLHSIEEALIRLEAPSQVLEGALLDEGRLQGSNIPQSATLLKRLRLAVADLSPTATQYLAEDPLSGAKAETAEARAARLAAGAPGAGGAEARAALAQVRSSINEFRDSRRDGLVRARNRLFGTVIFAGMTGCTLLYVAILSNVPKKAIVAAAAFYLVGGLVGLVKQLHSASTGEGAAQDDYGLGVVRLIQTPLFSGLAAVGGVVLVKLSQGQGQGAGGMFSLATSFDLKANPYGLVAAGFFGLTPALLLAGLQQRIDQYKSDLSNSGPSAAQAQAGGN
jgi:hypothetical protein